MPMARASPIGDHFACHATSGDFVSKDASVSAIYVIARGNPNLLVVVAFGIGQRVRAHRLMRWNVRRDRAVERSERVKPASN